MPTSKQRVAIIHDWLLGYRGGERVVDAIAQMYPDADVFTLFHRSGGGGPFTQKHRITASVLNRLPFVGNFYRWLLPLLPWAIQRFDLKGYDLILSSSHCVAKGVRIPKGALHICYCYTPMRYVWDQYDEYFAGKWYEPLLPPVMRYLRNWDVRTSQGVAVFLTLSDWVAKRIRDYYQRDSQVIYPFADVENFTVRETKDDFYLVVSAFAPYKRIELAIAACQALGRRLVVVGTGQEDSKLRALGAPGTEFRGSLPTPEVRDLYARARALLFTGVEDFGITPLEAMASGTPVIAFGRGGVTETVIEGKTGLFFLEPTAGSLIEAIKKFEARPPFSPKDCRERAEEFTRARFQTQLREAIEGATQRKL